MFEIELFIRIKMDLTLNNLQWFICHKPKQTNKLIILVIIIVIIFIFKNKHEIRLIVVKGLPKWKKDTLHRSSNSGAGYLEKSYDHDFLKIMVDISFFKIVDEVVVICQATNLTGQSSRIISLINWYPSDWVPKRL